MQKGLTPLLRVSAVVLVPLVAAYVVMRLAADRSSTRTDPGEPDISSPSAAAQSSRPPLPSAPDREPTERTPDLPGEKTEPVAATPVAEPVDVARLLAEAQACIQRKAFDKAVPLLDQALGGGLDTETELRVRLQLLDALLLTQQFDRAREIGESILGLAPDEETRLRVNIKLAGISRATGQTEVAEAQLREMLRAADDREREVIQAQLLNLWRSKPERLEEVAAELEGARAAGTASAQDLRLLGAVYLQAKQDPFKAVPVYETLHAAEPADLAAKQTLARLYEKTNQPAKAISIYESCLPEAGDNAGDIHYKIASLTLSSGRGDEAAAYAQDHLAGPDATVAELRQAARIFERAARTDQAAEALGRAAQLADSPAKRIKIRFERAELLAENNDQKAAVAEVQAILGEPDLPTDAAARCRILLEKWGDAP